MTYSKKILVTGGAGFIGSHLVRLLVKKYSDYQIVNFDKLTYAGNLENLRDIEHQENYEFFKGDICSEVDLKHAFETYDINAVIHLAAESHVDRSIANPIELSSLIPSSSTKVVVTVLVTMAALKSK